MSDEDLQKIKPKNSSGLFGFGGKAKESFEDLLEQSAREMAEQMTYLDFDSFLRCE
jgi:hypothetical protein